MANWLFLAVLMLYSVPETLEERVKIEDCGSAFSKLEEVDAIPCPSQPCALKRGTTETVEVRFIPKENITRATTVVHGVIGGVPVPFPVQHPDACVGQGITCPMIAGKEYKFKTSLLVKTVYPPLDLVVKWQLQDQNDRMVYCWELPVQIV